MTDRPISVIRNISNSIKMLDMDDLPAQSWPYAYALLACAMDYPLAEHLGKFDHRHVAFADYCLRLARGDAPSTIRHLLEPVNDADENDFALLAHEWLGTLVADSLREWRQA